MKSTRNGIQVTGMRKERFWITIGRTARTCGGWFAYYRGNMVFGKTISRGL
jgi:hypothetical protein